MSSHVEWDYLFTWKISDFSLLYPYRLISPDFTVAALENSRWFLNLYLPSRDKDFVACYLVNRKNNESDKEFKLSFEIIMFLNETCIRKIREENIRFKNGDASSSCDFCRRDNLASEMKNNVIHNLTLLCNIKGQPTVHREPELTETLTRIVKHKSVVPWKIKFSEGKVNTDEETKFYLDGSIFKINLSVLQDEFSIVITSIFLKNNSYLTLIIGKAILYVDGRELSVVEETHILFGNGVFSWIFQSLISNKQLRDNSSDYVKNGEILLIFSFSSFLDAVSTAVRDLTDYTPAEEFIHYYPEFHCNLFLHEKSKDVILRIDKNNEQPVHKAVLISRSPVFFAMFEHDTIENQTGVIDLKDVDAETLKCFINFLYSDVLPTTMTNCNKVTKLLQLADRYRVRMLILACVDFLIAALSTNNVLDVLILADTIYQKRLKKACLNFAAHHYTDIFSSGWSKWTFENFKLHAEIYKCFVIKKLLKLKLNSKEVLQKW